MGFLDSLKKGASDLLAVGRQVAGTTLSIGASALNGVGTLITDPKKFIEDASHTVSEVGRHISNSASDGASMIQEGWEEARATGNPGMFLWKALGGTVQIASLGASDAIKEHVGSVSSVVEDELGNMTGFAISSDCDAITRVLLERNGGLASTVVNGDREVKEAIQEGDMAKANKIFGHMIDAAVVRPVGDTVATASALAVAGAGVAAATLGTGGLGTPAAVALAAAGLTGTLAGMHGAKSQVDFDLYNVADDVSDRIRSDVEKLRASGSFTEDDLQRYEELMTPYYQNGAYTGMGDQLGASQMGEGATNQDFKIWMLEVGGLDSNAVLAATRDPVAESLQVEPGTALAVRNAPETDPDEARGFFRAMSQANEELGLAGAIAVYEPALSPAERENILTHREPEAIREPETAGPEFSF